MSIKKSVGFRGVNLAADVRKVQGLLNSAINKFPPFGKQQKTLLVDGDCGDLTITAIKRFQTIVMAFHYPDSRVDPGGNTWKKLNGNKQAKQQVNNSVEFQKPRVDYFLRWLELTLNNTEGPINLFNESLSALSGSETSEPTVNSQINPMRQGDKRWGKTKLGNSATGSIHSYGCAMVSLTMAGTFLGERTDHWPKNLDPQDLTPLKVNEIFKKSGVFTANSYMLYIVGGAKALGMEGKDSGIGKKLQSSAIATIDAALKTGLVLGHVDYKRSWKGDHWILLTDKNSDGSYLGIDPTYGKPVTLYTSADSHETHASYALLYGRSTSMGENTPDNVKGYKLVRFVTLK